MDMSGAALCRQSDDQVELRGNILEFWAPSAAMASPWGLCSVPSRLALLHVGIERCLGAVE
jgi:hypothetical protein